LSLAGLDAPCPLSFSNLSKNPSLVKNTSLPVFNRGGLFEKGHRKTDPKIEKLKKLNFGVNPPRKAKGD